MRTSSICQKNGRLTVQLLLNGSFSVIVKIKAVLIRYVNNILFEKN